MTLRLERVASGGIDEAIASLGMATLARSTEGPLLEVDEARLSAALRALAFAGVRASVVATTLIPPHDARAAIGRGLAPLPFGVLALDVVHVRALPLGTETRRLLRGTWPWRRVDGSHRARCRDLLRRDDAVLGWRRRAWAPANVLRRPEVRRVVRPIVFDRTALFAPPEARTFARERAIAGWLFG
jgi:hypothetical protein